MATATTSTRNFEIFSRIQPHEYLRRFIDEDTRPDGRALLDFRKTMITANAITTADASAMVRLGGTTVVCGIKAEVCEPHIDRPDQGFFVPNVELSPLCSPQYRSGPPPDQAQAVSEFIMQLFTSSPLFPLTSLCIEPGQAAWVLYTDITCLNYDGNILDASLLAVVTALKNLTLPQASLNPGGVVEAKLPRVRPFELLRMPIASTFCLFNNHVLADPNHAEESLGKETISIVVDTEGHVCRVYKNGGVTVSRSVLEICFDRAVTRTQTMAELIAQS